MCGDMIYPNDANRCSNCLALNYNLQERLCTDRDGKTQYVTIYQCRECRRFQRTEKYSESYEMESSELLTLCLKHVPALQNQHHHSDQSTNGSGHDVPTAPLRVMEAKWVWTEPHSMRLKIHVTVRTELQHVPIQQRCIIPFHIQWKQCYDCSQQYKSRTWHAIVQVRQKYDAKITAHSDRKKKTGLHRIESAIRHAPKASSIRKRIIQMDHVKCGYDFYFRNVHEAQGFVTYLQTVYPMKVKTSSQVVSTDSKNNTAHVKHTLTADLITIQKHDMILIHKATPKNIYAGQFALVLSITNHIIHLQNLNFIISSSSNSHTKKNKAGGGDRSSTTMTMKQQQQQHDPNRLELSVDNYYKSEKNYQVVSSSNEMIRFVVLDIELVSKSSSDNYHQQQEPSNNNNHHHPYDKNYYALADVMIAREADMGVNDDTYHVRTHLGHILQVGDIVLGYDLLSSTKIQGMLHDQHDNTVGCCVKAHYQCPDIVLVKKWTPTKKQLQQLHYEQYDDDTIYRQKPLRSPQRDGSNPNSDDADNHDDDHNSTNDDDDDDDSVSYETIHETVEDVVQDDDNDSDNDNNHATTNHDDGDHHDEKIDNHISGIELICTDADEVDHHRRDGNNSADDDDDDDDNDDDEANESMITKNQQPLKTITKKKLRRKLRQQGKRKKALEDSAIRMGLIPN